MLESISLTELGERHLLASRGHQGSRVQWALISLNLDVFSQLNQYFIFMFPLRTGPKYNKVVHHVHLALHVGDSDWCRNTPVR